MHHATPVCLVGVCRSKQSVTLAPTSAPSVLTRQRQYCGTCASLTHSLLGTLVSVCATSLLSVVLPCPQPCTAAHRCWHAHRLQRQLLREPRTPSLTQRVGSSGFECDTAVIHARPFDHHSPPPLSRCQPPPPQQPWPLTRTMRACLSKGAHAQAQSHIILQTERACACGGMLEIAHRSAVCGGVCTCQYLRSWLLVARRRTHERICLLFSVRPSSHSLWLGRR